MEKKNIRVDKEEDKALCLVGEKRCFSRSVGTRKERPTRGAGGKEQQSWGKIRCF